MDFSLIPVDCIEIESQCPGKYSIQLLGEQGPLTFKMHGVHVPYGITRNKKGKAIVPIRFEDEVKYFKYKDFFEKLDKKIAERFPDTKYMPMLSNGLINPLVSTNFKGQSNMIIKDMNGDRVSSAVLPYNFTADVTLQIPYLWYLNSSQTRDQKQKLTGSFFVIKQIENFFSSRSNNQY